MIAGNWKMNKTTQEAQEFFLKLKEDVRGITDTEIVVCPPYTLLYLTSDLIKGSNISLGAQNVFWEEKGAYTGEISPLMLKDLGCKYCIVGHSERRQYFYETDETVNKKTRALISVGIVPIVCVGETLEEREKGKAFDVVKTQITTSLNGFTIEEIKGIVIAYEPVWAIGTGKTASSSQAEQMHNFIRNTLKEMYNSFSAEKVRILYGGSVKPKNIDELMAEEDIDGVLVGGASLDVDSFSRIVKFRRK